MTLTIPDRVYWFILATWTAAVFGVGVGSSHYYLSSPGRMIMVSPPRVTALESENTTLHNKVCELEATLAVIESRK